VAVAAGAPAGPVGIAIGLAVGWLVDKAKDLGSWLIRNAPKVAIGLGALLFGTGFALNSSLLMGTGGLVGFGGLVGQAGGVGPALSRAGGFASSVITGITSLAVASIAAPLIVALISIPVLVAIILFIINSGAYIVPPSSFSVLEENPHIGIVKEVSPSGPFENSNLPLTVTYTITITAKRGTLTNIGFEHKCGAIAKNSTNSCPAPLPQSIPQEISPVEPYVFTYTQTYSGSSYRDSLVINTFTVTADTPETTGASASGVASIIIGNPPTGCYKVAGTWPANERAAIMAATSNLVGRSPTFVARLCAAYSQVNLYYDPSKVCGVWGCAPGGNVIYFNSAGLGNTHNATYILAHESGHVLAYGSPNLYQAYLAFPPVDTVVFIREIITAKDKKTTEDITSQYGNAPYTLYGPASVNGFNLYVYLDKGIAYIGHVKEPILLEIWYFQPTTIEDFQVKWAKGYSTTHGPIQ